jgi:hypothetical protein
MNPRDHSLQQRLALVGADLGPLAYDYAGGSSLGPSWSLWPPQRHLKLMSFGLVRENSSFNMTLLSRNCPSKHDGSELRYWRQVRFDAVFRPNLKRRTTRQLLHSQRQLLGRPNIPSRKPSTRMEARRPWGRRSPIQAKPPLSAHRARLS